MEKVIAQWAGYCGETTRDKKPDGTIKETKHHKIWACCCTDEGLVIARHGSAKQPLDLQERVLDRKATLEDAVASFHARVREKSTRRKERYTEIPFEAAPHHVEHFARYLLNKGLVAAGMEASVTSAAVIEPAEADTGTTTVRTHLERVTGDLESPCEVCGGAHPAYLVDLGAGTVLPARTLLDTLIAHPDGKLWLETPCLLQGDTLVESFTTVFLGRLINVLVAPLPGAPDPALEQIPCLRRLRVGWLAYT